MLDPTERIQRSRGGWKKNPRQRMDVLDLKSCIFDSSEFEPALACSDLYRIAKSKPDARKNVGNGPTCYQHLPHGESEDQPLPPH